MTDIVAERDAWLAMHPERAMSIGGRRWGMIEVGGEDESDDAAPDAPQDETAASAESVAGGAGPAADEPVADAAGAEADPTPLALLLPGSLGRADILWRVMSRLEGQARMISVTYPATHDMTVWADDLARLLDRAGAEQAGVYGTSIGGYLAQLFAARHPDRVSRLVIANTVASVAFLADVPPYAGDPMRTPMSQLREGFGRGLMDWAVRHPDQADAVALVLSEIRGRIPARNLRARLMALRHAPPAPAIPLPASRISLIESSDDPVIDAARREGLRAHLRPGVVYRFAEGGHHAFIMRPGLYAAAMAEGLGLTPPGAGPWGTGALRVR